MGDEGSGKRYSSEARLNSFRFAFRGLSALFRYEPNAAIEIIILAIVVVAGILLGISKSDWIAITIVSSLVITGEAFNSAIENLSDFVCPGKDERIKKVKDLAAAAVLVSAIGAVVVGLIIFVPEILDLIRC
jgi:diacylglycerol kinase